MTSLAPSSRSSVSSPAPSVAYQPVTSPEENDRTTPSAPIPQPPPAVTRKPSAHAPWFTITAIAISLICSALSTFVLYYSANRPVESWRVRPAVVLSTASTIMTTALGITLGDAVTIAWWRAASRPRGASLAQLHYVWAGVHWRSWGAFVRALKAGHEVRLVLATLAALAAATLAHGPLLQKATFDEIRNGTETVEVAMNMSRHVPAGWTGTHGPPVQEAGDGQEGFDVVVHVFEGFLQDVQDWFWGQPVVTRDETDAASRPVANECDGGCEGSIVGAGLAVACDSADEEVDFNGAASLNKTIFEVRFERVADADDISALRADFAHLPAVSATCRGAIKRRSCLLKAADTRYALDVDGRAVRPRLNASAAVGAPYTSPGDALPAEAGTPAGLLGALHAFGYGFLSAHANHSVARASAAQMRHDFAIDRADPFVQNTLTFQLMRPAPGACARGSVVPGTQSAARLEPGAWTFEDPAPFVLDALADLAFRTAARAGRDRGRSVAFEARRRLDELVFRSSLGFLWGAHAVAALALAMLVASSWGFWRFERKLSLSPVELARVFGAPVVGGAEGKGLDAEELVETFGHVRVRYAGEVMSVVAGERAVVEPADEDLARLIGAEGYPMVTRPAAHRYG
ncbi:hypothetical protein BDY21DRAFT_363989 [Lineolata rhizophorae]|uniref:Uncharacterized protein n=1 Tax=Lineolata rhizophorae TaxID=578093 RepID=A0A6A6P0R3_9PEZI|nr:hypothetical protein BDY21DRAFT_363989 [Lineolata rhizophorae]